MQGVKCPHHESHPATRFHLILLCSEEARKGRGLLRGWCLNVSGGEVLSRALRLGAGGAAVTTGGVFF
ncbi:hypothetical protein ACN38_g11550 [Penicillium nordicum]|uniref:Uncharacterized protein n=1 Tax=Penicillium nordicum TaxID=229535 RepID=A0A0M8NR19_9EURO|nr:hypothetical protein ACN38_g11550 [Penicillium nordicum]